MKVALSKFSATTTTTIDLVEHLQILHCCVSFIEWFLNLKKNLPKKWNLGVSESLHHEKLILPLSDLGFVKKQLIGPTNLIFVGEGLQYTQFLTWGLWSPEN